MGYLLTTTGTTPSFTLDDLGERVIVHPQIDLDLSLEYNPAVLLESNDLQNAITQGWMTLEDPLGNPISDLSVATQGATGPQGLQGNVGNDGVTGSQGIQGPTGSQGIQGPQGLQGFMGIQGPQGLQGMVGDDGATGSQGSTGPQGVPGPTVYGTEFQYEESEGNSSTTSSTYQTKVTLTTSDLPSGTYEVTWYMEALNSSTSGVTDIRIRIGTTEIAQTEMEHEDSSDWMPHGGFKITSMSGVNSITLQYRRLDNGTTTVRRARLKLLRVS